MADRSNEIPVNEAISGEMNQWRYSLTCIWIIMCIAYQHIIDDMKHFIIESLWRTSDEKYSKVLMGIPKDKCLYWKEIHCIVIIIASILFLSRPLIAMFSRSPYLIEKQRSGFIWKSGIVGTCISTLFLNCQKFCEIGIF